MGTVSKYVPVVVLTVGAVYLFREIFRFRTNGGDSTGF